MAEENITITNSEYRDPNDMTSEELKEYSAEKLRRAEEKENERLESAWQKSVERAEKRKKFLAAIKRIFVKNNNAIQQSEQNQH